MKRTSRPTTAHNDSLFDRLKLIRTCPVCARDYTGSEVHILDEYQGGHHVHITCTACRSSLIGVVVATSAGVSSVYGRTDLSVVDILRLRHREPVDEGAVLSFHTYLETPQQFETHIISHA